MKHNLSPETEELTIFIACGVALIVALKMHKTENRRKQIYDVFRYISPKYKPKNHHSLRKLVQV